MKIKTKIILFLIFLIPLATTQVYAVTAPSSDDTNGEFTSADVAALIFYILLALLFSSMCSVAEAVLLNMTPSYIAEMRERNPKFAKVLQEFRTDKVDQSLAAILTMNTIAHTIGAIGSGAKATVVFGSAWFGLFSAIMTLLILFVSEIIPKTVGVMYWRQLARIVILYIRILRKSLYPFIWISEVLTKLITKGKEVHVFNKDEFVAMARVGASAGAFLGYEARILQNLFRLSKLTVEDIYTPRTVILGFEQDMTVSEVFEKQKKIPFSRLVIYEKDLDHITGFILTDDLLALVAEDKDNTKLVELKRDIKPIGADMPLSDLLTYFIDSKQQIALVVDDFGTKGLVSIEDVIETLLGIEIMDENDVAEDMQLLARDIWRKRMNRLGVEVEEKL